MSIRSILKHLLCLCISLLVVSCQKAVEDEPSNPSEIKNTGKVTVTLRVADLPNYENVTPVRATPISALCTRVDVFVYQDGESCKTIHQQQTDADFGTLQLTLPKGSYTYVVVAHSGEGAVQATSPSHVVLTKKGLTDTFYAYNALEVSEESSTTVTLKRATALVRWVMEDAMPVEVEAVTIQVVPGATVLDATTGQGANTTSLLAQTFVIPDALYGKATRYDLYVLPRKKDDSCTLRVLVKGKNGNLMKNKDGNTVMERPMTLSPNVRYTLSGSFFVSSSTGGGGTPSAPQISNGLQLSTSDEWLDVRDSY